MESCCFIESSLTGAGTAVVHAASKRGFAPIVLTKRLEHCSHLEHTGAKLIQVDTSDLEALKRVLREIDGRTPIKGVGSTHDSGVVQAARLARHLGLPGPDPSSVERCRFKPATRDALEGTGLNPQSRVVNTAAAAVQASDAIGYPVVVKPTSMTGSSMVRLCADAEQVRTAQAMIADHAPLALVEGYIVGPEFSIEVIDGVAVGVTGKDLSAPPFFIEQGFVVPAEVDPDGEHALKSAAELAVATVGLTWGPAHVEARLSSAGPRIIEINPRLGGMRIPELVELATGRNMVDRYVASLLGHKAPILIGEGVGAAAIEYALCPMEGGTLSHFDPMPAKRVEGYRDFILFGAVGERYDRDGSNWDVVFGVMATGRTAPEARRNAAAAASRVECAW